MLLIFVFSPDTSQDKPGGTIMYINFCLFKAFYVPVYAGFGVVLV